MKSPKQKTAAHATAPAPPPQPPPDPIEVIGQHWSDLTGLSRKDAIALLAQIGHCTMKENRAGVATFRRELETLVNAKASEQASQE